MPILISLDIELAKKKMSLTELSSKTGITIANLSILKTGKARAIRFSTLELICLELECQPADILQRVTKKEYARLCPERGTRSDSTLIFYPGKRLRRNCCLSGTVLLPGLSARQYPQQPASGNPGSGDRRKY